jgi:hypothetical protein
MVFDRTVGLGAGAGFRFPATGLGGSFQAASVADASPSPGFALDGETIRFHDGDRYPAFICRSCGLRQSQVLNGKCTAFRCRGEVDPISAEERSSFLLDNHYLASYDEPGHVTVRAREHTASLSTDLREQIERQFAERKSIC